MKTGASIAAVVFFLVALAHVFRIGFAVPITVGSVEIPLWTSAAVVVISMVLALLVMRDGCVTSEHHGKDPLHFGRHA